MKLIFVSGKYLDKDPVKLQWNIEVAKRLSHELMKQGWAVICPNMNTAGCEVLDMSTFDISGIEDWQMSSKGDFFYAMYLEILSRCDAIIMLENWLKSKGAGGEHKFARLNAIPIFYVEDGLPHLSDLGARP